MHKLSLWQKIGLIALVLVAGSALALGVHYHNQVQAKRQQQDQVYQQLDRLTAAKAAFKSADSDTKRLAKLKALIKQADEYAASAHADASVKRQYESAIKADRQIFSKQDYAALHKLTPEAKALAKMTTADVNKQIQQLKDLANTIKSHQHVVYSTKAYQHLQSQVSAAIKTQQDLLKKRDVDTKKAAASSSAKASADTDSASSSDTTDATDNSADTTDATTAGTAATSGDTGNGYSGNTNYASSSQSGYTWRPRYSGGTWQPSQSTSASTAASASSTPTVSEPAAQVTTEPAITSDGDTLPADTTTDNGGEATPSTDTATEAPAPTVDSTDDTAK